MDRQRDGKTHKSRLLRPPRRGFLRRLRYYFLAGFIVSAPIGITVVIAWEFIAFVDNQITPLIPPAYNPESYLPFSIPGLGLVVIFFVVTLIGFLTASILGRTLVGLGEQLVDRMPVVRTIYGALKQIFETVLAQSSKSFREVVLVEYPRRGLWAVAFVTSTTEGEVAHLSADELVNIFLPTTPNPTSGFLLFVPRSDLVVLEMTVEEGIKLVISGGIVTPPDRRPEAAQGVKKIFAPATVDLAQPEPK